MTSKPQRSDEMWLAKMESILGSPSAQPRRTIGLRKLLKTVAKYDSIHVGEQEARVRARELILEASKRLVERSLVKHRKAFLSREGSNRKLRAISTVASQLSDLLGDVLLHIDELVYSREVLEGFMPKLEEAARFATELEPETAAHVIKILNSADTLGVCYNHGLREVFEEVIQLRIVRGELNKAKVLLERAEVRFGEGEYLTSYLLSREAVSIMLEEIAGAFPEDLSPQSGPSPEWRLEDYIGYVHECGLITETQGKGLLDLFVGEPEHMNARWRKRRDSEKALIEATRALAAVDEDGSDFDEWL